MYGYTLSHLRRVPELSLLARRVVKADARRQAKEERQKSRSSRPRSGAETAVPSQTARKTEDVTTGVTTKRLFKQAIRTLFSEGDIVLWHGPVRPLPTPSLDPLLPLPSSSALWKANTSTASTATSMSSSRYDEWDEDEQLSDPSPSEEAYVPLTPAYFERVLEGAIRSMMTEAASSRADHGESTPKANKRRQPIPFIEQLHAREQSCPAPPPGPTKAELLAWLRDNDERWARVGEWAVEEALQYGKREGRLWCVGKGRWEVCE